MDPRYRQLSDQIDDATQVLLSSARLLHDSELAVASALDGWTRGHVLAHLARGADAMRTALAAARAGREYPGAWSPQQGDDAIAWGARQPATDLTADVADTAMALRTVTVRLPDAAWEFNVAAGGQEPLYPADLLTRRLVEVVLHHCDLAMTYGPQFWPAAFAQLELPEPMRTQRQQRLDRPPLPPPPPDAVSRRRAAANPAPPRPPRPWSY